MTQTLACSIELSKSKGITITVSDADAKRTQTIVMNGTTITMQIKVGEDALSVMKQSSGEILTTVKTSEHTSELKQTPTGLTIKCQDFAVESDTFSVDAKKSLQLASEDELGVKCKGPMEIKSEADCRVQVATALVARSNQTAELAATTSMKLTAPDLTMSGDQVRVKGTATLALAGADGSVKGDAQGAVRAPLTKVGRDITMIEGQVVEVKGSLIKLG